MLSGYSLALDAEYHDKICVYVKHPIAGQNIQYQAHDSRSRHTTPFGDIIKYCVTCKQSWIPMILVIKSVIAIIM